MSKRASSGAKAGNKTRKDAKAKGAVPGKPSAKGKPAGKPAAKGKGRPGGNPVAKGVGKGSVKGGQQLADRVLGFQGMAELVAVIDLVAISATFPGAGDDAGFLEFGQDSLNRALRDSHHHGQSSDRQVGVS